jgi:hypothetical protein
MLEMVEARRNADKVEERYDLFRGLLDATQDEPDNEAALNDEELIGGHSTSPSFGSIGKRLIRPPRKHVCLSFWRTRGRIFLFLRHCLKPFHYRPRRILYASHLPCWLSTRMNKSACMNTSKVLFPV